MFHLDYLATKTDPIIINSISSLNLITNIIITLLIAEHVVPKISEF